MVAPGVAALKSVTLRCDAISGGKGSAEDAAWVSGLLRSSFSFPGCCGKGWVSALVVALALSKYEFCGGVYGGVLLILWDRNLRVRVRVVVFEVLEERGEEKEERKGENRNWHGASGRSKSESNSIEYIMDSDLGKE